MKATTVYAWTPEDESLHFAEYATNLLAAFHPSPLNDPTPELKAFRRVVENGDSFTAADVETAARYLESQATRAQARADSLQEYVESAKSTPAERDLAKGLVGNLQGAEKAGREAAARLRLMFVQGLPGNSVAARLRSLAHEIDGTGTADLLMEIAEQAEGETK